MKTSCEKCIFRVDDPALGVQVGCKFYSRLKKYKEMGLAEYKGNALGYYEINSFCKACTKVKKGQEIPKDINEIVKARITPTVDAVIILDECKEAETVSEYVSKLSKEGFSSIHVAPSSALEPNFFFKIREAYSEVKLTTTIGAEYDLEYVDRAVYKCSSDYVMILKDCLEYPEKPLEKVIKLETEDLVNFIAIFGDGLHGSLINRRIYKAFAGNFPVDGKNKNIIEKLTEYNDTEGYFLKWT